MHSVCLAGSSHRTSGAHLRMRVTAGLPIPKYYCPLPQRSSGFCLGNRVTRKALQKAPFMKEQRTLSRGSWTVIGQGNKRDNHLPLPVSSVVPRHRGWEPPKARQKVP